MESMRIRRLCIVKKYLEEEQVLKLLMSLRKYWCIKIWIKGVANKVNTHQEIGLEQFQDLKLNQIIQI